MKNKLKSIKKKEIRIFNYFIDIIGRLNKSYANGPVYNFFPYEKEISGLRLSVFLKRNPKILKNKYEIYTDANGEIFANLKYNSLGIISSYEFILKRESKDRRFIFSEMAGIKLVSYSEFFHNAKPHIAIVYGANSMIKFEIIEEENKVRKIIASSGNISRGYNFNYEKEMLHYIDTINCPGGQEIVYKGQ